MVAAFAEMVCRVSIALVFALSARGKARDMAGFEAAIGDFRVFPRGWSRMVARGVVGAELAVVVSMSIGGRVLLVGFLLAGGLLTVFSVALMSVLRRNLRVACNCFGPTERRVSPYDVARNALLIGCGAVGIWTFGASVTTLPVLETVLACAVAASLAVLLTNLADVVETLRRPFEVEV